MFTTSLRVLAAPCGVDVVCVQPGFIDIQVTKQMHGQGGAVGQSPSGQSPSDNVEELAARMKDGVEKGDRGIVIWPANQGIAMHALRGVFDFLLLEKLGVQDQLVLQDLTRFARNLGSGSL
jgi:NAD(P)-dependent dehydrogenase (short-subunit alcohol dehydrogenase family)